jgi:uncharacterized protein
MIYPKIDIYTDNSGDFTAQYICFLAKGISMGTYQEGGYIVLPHLSSGNTKTVHFPDLNYSREFWRTINFCPNINLSTRFPENAIGEVKKKLAGQIKDNELILKKIIHDWSQIESGFFELTEQFLDLKPALNKVEKIKVLLTPFGTRGSFNPPRVGNNFNLMVTSRIDCPAGNIALGILQNLFIIKTKIGGEIGSENYLKRMSAINFIFGHTAFSKFYPDFADLTKPDFTIDEDLLKSSAKFLKKLGFPNKEILTLNDGQIFLNGNHSNGTFSIKETSFLKAIIAANGNILSFDDTAEILWGESADEKFSLEAMAKMIEVIRRKIRDAGIHKNLIFTARGKGYFLNN